MSRARRLLRMAADELVERNAEAAQAKVNLFLHVLGRRPDGLHLIESLAVFPEVGDELRAVLETALSLEVTGPFASGLTAGGQNLVIDAAAALSAALKERLGARLRLEKRLPVASGIGGGSADAAAALRLLCRVWGRQVPAERLAEIALELGADVPVCLAGKPSLMQGVGERLSRPPGFPGGWITLVNPMRGLATAEVFRALERRENPPSGPAPARFADFEGLVTWLSAQRNDLQGPAEGLMPVIGDHVAALRRTRGCRLARMSGSGATVFGLFERQAEAEAAAAEIRRAEPGWWTVAARLPGYDPDLDRAA